MAGKYSELQMQQFLSNDMVHMAYRVNSVTDIVCPYAAKGYECLGTEFASFIEEMLPYLPEGKPVVMEIAGAPLDADEQETIISAIRNHYRIQRAKADHEAKANAVRMVWFLASLILSAVLLFGVGDDTENVIVQYAYLPFWFFGYRLLIYVIIDLIPQLKHRKQMQIIAGMKVVFTADKPINEVPDEKKQAYLDEISETIAQGQDTDYRRMQEDFLLEADGKAHITCRISGVEDVTRSSSIGGYELLNEELTTYLDQALSCTPDQTPIVIDVENETDQPLTEQDKTVIIRAIETHLDFKLEDAAGEASSTSKQIGWFAALLIVSSIILWIGEHGWDKAMLEFATMMFWFFGDYLIEYVILGRQDAAKEKRRCTHYRQAKIRFR